MGVKGVGGGEGYQVDVLDDENDIVLKWYGVYSNLWSYM